MDALITGATIWLADKVAGKILNDAINHLLKKMGIRSSPPKIQSLLETYMQQLTARLDEDRIAQLYGALSQLKDAQQTVVKQGLLTHALSTFHVISHLPEQGITGGRRNTELRCIAFLGMATAHICLEDQSKVIAEKMVAAIQADSSTAEQWLGIQVVQSVLTRYSYLQAQNTASSLLKPLEQHQSQSFLSISPAKKTLPMGTQLLCYHERSRFSRGNSCAWSPDGKRIAILGRCKEQIEVWDTAEWRLILTCGDHYSYGDYCGAGHLAFAWSPDSTRLAASCSCGMVLVWDACNGKALLTYTKYLGNARSVAWSPDGTRLASCSSNDHIAEVWDAHSGRVLWTHTASEYGVSEVAWSSNGRYLASRSIDCTQVLDVRNGKILSTYKDYGVVYAMMWSPDGTRLVFCLLSPPSFPILGVQVWDAHSGRVLLTYKGHTRVVSAVAWSPDGTLLASCSSDRTIQVWQARSGRILSTYRCSSDTGACMAWSPDGTCLAVGSDNMVQVWHVHNAKVLMTYTKHTDRVYEVRWSPDGTRLASCSSDLTVQVWQAV